MQQRQRYMSDARDMTCDVIAACAEADAIRSEAEQI